MIYQKKERMTVVRLRAMRNLYRYSDDRWPSGRPKRIECFNPHPAVRAVLGRWSDCPNIGVGTAIMRLGSEKMEDQRWRP